jgi:hydroxymethylbilane synthase
VTSKGTLRIGTRGSALALWQTERVRSLLSAAGYATERVEIRTTGDLVQDVPLSRIGTRALFTKQIDDALLAERIDLAVHSLKDLPTVLPAGIELGAVGEREDSRDALVGRSPLRWADVPQGATIATSSLRRRAQLLHARPDLRISDIRGNVDTRLAKLEANAEWTAIVLAAAGLVRLGLGHRIGERLPLEVMLPAPGQGALAVTVRKGDAGSLAAARAAVQDEATAIAVAAERAFLRRLEGGCQVPVGAYAELEHLAGQTELRLHGRIVSLLGERAVEGHASAADADQDAAATLGTSLAEQLLVRGGAEILAGVRGSPQPVVTEP